MDNRTMLQADGMAVSRKNHHRWTAVLVVLSVIVAFVVAVWLTKVAHARTHTEKVLTCSYQVHQHTADCYDAGGNLICGLADYVIHTHNDDCYDADGNLVCPLPEVQAHTHDDSCYVEETYLTCGLEESAGHTHTADCYEEVPILICANEDPEHVHTDECYEYEMVLICGQEESAGHTHTADCYTTTRTLVCDKPEIQQHIHTDDCYEIQYETVTDADGNTYQAEVGRTLICGQLQTEEHTHGEDCFTTVELTAEEVAAVNETAETELPQLTDEEVSNLITTTDAAASGETAAEDTAASGEVLILAENASNEISDTTASSEADVAEEPVLYTTEDDIASVEPTIEDESEETVGNLYTLTFENDSYRVTVMYGDDAAIPEGAVLDVTEVTEDNELYSDYIGQASDALASDVTGNTNRVLDINIVCDGQVIEPAAEITVSVEFLDETLNSYSSYSLVHAGEAGGNVVTASSAMDNSTATFGTDGLSPYVFSFSENEAGVMTKTFVQDDLVVTITYDKDAGIPDDAELVVERIESGTEYKHCMKEAASVFSGGISSDNFTAEELADSSEEPLTDGEETAVTDGEEAPVSDGNIELISVDGTQSEEISFDELQGNTLILSQTDSQNEKVTLEMIDAQELETQTAITAYDLFDISIMVNGQEYEPQDIVTTTISFSDSDFNDADNAAVVHYADDGVEVPETQSIEVDSAGTVSVTVEMDSYSAVAVTATRTTALSTSDTYIICTKIGSTYYPVTNTGAIATNYGFSIDAAGTASSVTVDTNYYWKLTTASGTNRYMIYNNAAPTTIILNKWQDSVVDSCIVTRDEGGTYPLGFSASGEGFKFKYWNTGLASESEPAVVASHSSYKLTSASSWSGDESENTFYFFKVNTSTATATAAPSATAIATATPTPTSASTGTWTVKTMAVSDFLTEMRASGTNDTAEDYVFFYTTNDGTAYLLGADSAVSTVTVKSSQNSISGANTQWTFSTTEDVFWRLSGGSEYNSDDNAKGYIMSGDYYLSLDFYNYYVNSTDGVSQSDQENDNSHLVFSALSSSNAIAFRDLSAFYQKVRISSWNYEWQTRYSQIQFNTTEKTWDVNVVPYIYFTDGYCLHVAKLVQTSATATPAPTATAAPTPTVAPTPSADLSCPQHSDVDETAINNWLAKLDGNTLLNVDKTAEVYDYENRIYQIDLQANSNVMDLEDNLALTFIMDISNSMLFPASLPTATKTNFQLSTSNLDNLLGSYTSSGYYTGSGWNKRWVNGETTYYSRDHVYIALGNNIASTTATQYVVWYETDSSKCGMTGWLALDASYYARCASGALSWQDTNTMKYGKTDYRVKQIGDSATNINERDTQYTLYDMTGTDWLNAIQNGGSTNGVNNIYDPLSSGTTYVDADNRLYYLKQSLTNALADLNTVSSNLPATATSVKVAWETFAQYVYHKFDFKELSSETLTEINGNIGSLTSHDGTRPDKALIAAMQTANQVSLSDDSMLSEPSYNLGLTNEDETFGNQNQKSPKYKIYDSSTLTTDNDSKIIDWNKVPTTSYNRYAILITDGAALMGSGQDETATTTMNNWIAEYAKYLKENYDVTLITIGLGMNDVVSGKQSLYNIASWETDSSGNYTGEKLFWNAEDAASLQNILLAIIKDLMYTGCVDTDVTDTIDSAFYIVDPYGNPLKEGDWITLDGTKIPASQHSLYEEGGVNYQQENVGYGVIGKNTDGDWTVTWHNQLITNWQAHVFVKAKEDFLGGNNINTNEGSASYSVNGYSLVGGSKTVPSSSFKSSVIKNYTCDTPYVNVDELRLNTTYSEWTVYLGTQVDPLTQLKQLYNQLMVDEVVTVTKDTDGDGKADHVIYDTSGSMMYTLASSAEDSVMDTRTRITGGSETMRITAEQFPLSDVALLTDEQWAALLSKGSVDIPYSAYGHSNDGTIHLTLTKKLTDSSLNSNNAWSKVHATTVTGGTISLPTGLDGVEQYTIGVTFTPSAEDTSLNRHTGTNILGATDDGIAVTSDNTLTKSNAIRHDINVYVGALTLEKDDMSGTKYDKGNATFELYTTNNGKADGTVTSTQTIKTIKGLATLNNLPVGTYFLKETAAPEGLLKAEGTFKITVTPNKWYAGTTVATGDDDKVTVNSGTDITTYFDGTTTYTGNPWPFSGTGSSATSARSQFYTALFGLDNDAWHQVLNSATVSIEPVGKNDEVQQYKTYVVLDGDGKTEKYLTVSSDATGFSYTVAYNNSTTANVYLRVKNFSTYEMPATGGIGLTTYYLLGGAALLLCFGGLGTWLLVRRRKARG